MNDFEFVPVDPPAFTHPKEFGQKALEKVLEGTRSLHPERTIDRVGLIVVGGRIEDFSLLGGARGLARKTDGLAILFLSNVTKEVSDDRVPVYAGQKVFEVVDPLVKIFITGIETQCVKRVLVIGFQDIVSVTSWIPVPFTLTGRFGNA